MSTKLEDHYIEAKAAAKLYAEAEADLLKLKLAKKTTRFSGKLVMSVIVLLLGIVCITILLIALGFAFADYFENTALGFLCSAGAGILLTLLASLTLRRLIERSFIKKVLKELSNE